MINIDTFVDWCWLMLIDVDWCELLLGSRSLERESILNFVVRILQVTEVTIEEDGWQKVPTKQAKRVAMLSFTACPTCCWCPVWNPCPEAANKAAKEEREQRAAVRKEREVQRDAAWLGAAFWTTLVILFEKPGGAYKIPSWHVPNTEAGRCNNNCIFGKKSIIILYGYKLWFSYIYIFKFKYHLFIFVPSPTLWNLALIFSRATPAETASKAAWTWWVESCRFFTEQSNLW